MTEGQVKKKLNQYRDAREKFDNARMKLEETENLLTSISIDYTRERVQGSPKTLDRIGELVDKLSILRKECMEEAWQAVKTMETVTEFIKKCDDTRLQSILVKRHILIENWDKIAEDLGVTSRHIFRMYDEAIQKLRKN